MDEVGGAGCVLDWGFWRSSVYWVDSSEGVEEYYKRGVGGCEVTGGEEGLEGMGRGESFWTVGVVDIKYIDVKNYLVII